MSLVSLEDVKTFLGISGTDFDDKLTVFLESVEDSVKNYCGTDFTTNEVTKELHDGLGADVIVPKYFPVLSVQGVYFNCEADGENGYELDNTLYTFDESAIYLRGTHTPEPIRRIVRIDYTYGYASLPSAVKLAIMQSVKAEYQRDSQSTENIASRSKEDESESYNAAWDKATGLPVQILSKLQPYKELEWPVEAGMAQRNL